MGKRMVIRNNCPLCKHFLWIIDKKGTTLFCNKYNKKVILRYKGLKNCPDYIAREGGK